MAKWQNDAMLDAALNYIKTNAILLTVCEGQPASYAEATTNKGGGGKKLADIAVDTNDFTLGDDTSGRKCDVAEQLAVDIDVTGDGDHIALCSGAALLYVTTAPTKALGSGGTVDIGAWKINILDVS